METTGILKGNLLRTPVFRDTTDDLFSLRSVLIASDVVLDLFSALFRNAQRPIYVILPLQGAPYDAECSATTFVVGTLQVGEKPLLTKRLYSPKRYTFRDIFAYLNSQRSIRVNATYSKWTCCSRVQFIWFRDYF